jgi:hypothetical protein
MTSQGGKDARSASPAVPPARGSERRRRLLASLVPLLLVGLAPVVLPAADEKDPPETAGKLSNKLKWSTATETENFGYDVYRGDSEEGPFTRITEEVIPGAGTSDLPSYYEFVDDSIEPGRAYYYYVESISMSGVRERFTPVIRARPKGKVAGSGAAAGSDPEPPS